MKQEMVDDEAWLASPDVKVKVENSSKILKFPAAILNDIFHHNAAISRSDMIIDDAKPLTSEFKVARRSFRAWSKFLFVRSDVPVARSTTNLVKTKQGTVHSTS
jgi:hypothetical protein